MAANSTIHNENRSECGPVPTFTLMSMLKYGVMFVYALGLVSADIFNAIFHSAVLRDNLFGCERLSVVAYNIDCIYNTKHY